MGTNRRYGTPSEREERYRAAQAERERQDRERRRPHCWVTQRGRVGPPLPGVLVEWVRVDGTTQWLGRVVYVELDGTVVDGWRYASELAPARTEDPASTRDGEPTFT